MAGPRQDHPRSRGVYSLGRSHISALGGSSPLARGLPGRVFPGQRCRRIIPARAGFTDSCERSMWGLGDHPRSRGVYWDPSCVEHLGWGSSPLARGLRLAEELGAHGMGIIPARAGFTRASGTFSPRARDHPRSRGVYAPHQPGGAPPSGSSPLARGLLAEDRLGLPLRRIIPARAGFTRAARPATPSGRDHPRSRGVYHLPEGTPMTCPGSSPLARGLRLRQLGREERGRIIPARAGFTLADPWNPNDEPHYQTAFAFTADLALAPQSSDSAVVSQRLTRTPSEA